MQTKERLNRQESTLPILTNANKRETKQAVKYLPPTDQCKQKKDEQAVRHTPHTDQGDGAPLVYQAPQNSPTTVERMLQSTLYPKKHLITEGNSDVTRKVISKMNTLGSLVGRPPFVFPSGHVKRNAPMLPLSFPSLHGRPMHILCTFGRYVCA
jgi:hypothetical protein